MARPTKLKAPCSLFLTGKFLMIPKYTKYIVILLVVMLIAIALLIVQFGRGKDARVYFLTSVLIKYIENNNGAYPETEKS